MFLKILAVLATLIVVIFSIFFLIGLWVGPTSPSPSLPPIGPEDAEDRVLITSDFELPTLNLFLRFATSGRLPNGALSSLPHFPPPEIARLARPYAEWAPKPFSELPSLALVPGIVASGVSPPVMIRVAHVMSGLDEVVRGVVGREVERSFRVVKAKVWFGIAPVTEVDWRERSLDEMSNIEEAIAIIRLVVDVFQYLREPNVQGTIREGYNRIWGEWDVFQDAVNAMQDEMGEKRPEWSLSKLWQEYMHNHFAFMESQARAWAFRRLLALHTVWKAHFMDVLQSGHSINDTQTTVRIDHHAMLILNTLLDLYLDADISIRARTDGFFFAHGVDKRLVGGDTTEKSRKQLNGVYAGIEAKRVADMRSVVQAAVNEHKRMHEATRKVPGFMKAPMAVTHREFGYKQVQPQFEAPLPLEAEGWVRELGTDEVETFGFVAYRVSYEESDDKWAEFLTKVEQGVELGWDGVVGAESTKRKAMLHWVDGQAVGIAEGDLEGVQRHLNSNIPSSTTVSNQICIVATPDAVSSFLLPSAAKSTGHSQPYLIAMSASATKPKNASTDATSHSRNDTITTSPSAPTTFKTPPRLLYTDLYALGVYYPTLSAVDFAALAGQHPLGLYQGFSTGVRRREWRKVKESSVNGHDVGTE
ncbi:hypothetical protein V496_06624 [Pseudogymnoascus sp. VKM F-4515 (FW-2607)]|nr:hypothetical protein V496_06624 [Pseudogymnoascus sp. VKM F-4515 (FW-2607)]